MTLLSRTAPLAAICAVALSLTATASAQNSAATIASLSAQLDSANAAKADALATINQTDEEAGPKIKEVKLWDDQIKGLQPQVDYVVEKRKRHDADAAVVNQKIQTHNAGCHGTLPRPQYERCKGEERYLQPQIDRITASKNQIDSEASALRGRINNIENRRGALVGQLQQIKARQDAARSRLAEAERRIADLTARLRRACNEGGSAEALAYCGQVDWDGARRGLKAPNLQPRPFSASPN